MAYFCFGRLILGFAIGIYSSATPLYINEIVPSHLSGTLGSLYQLFVTLAIVISYAFAYVMPKDDRDPEVVRDSVSWRLVMALPLLFSVIQVLSLVFVYKYDSPAYYASKGMWQNVLAR